MAGSIPRNVKSRNTKKKSTKKATATQVRNNPAQTIQAFTHESCRGQDAQDANMTGIEDGVGPFGPEAAGTSTGLGPSLSRHLANPNTVEDVPAGRVFYTDFYPPHFTPADIQSTVGIWTLIARPESRNKCPCCMQYDSQNGWLVTSIAGVCINKGKDSPLSRSAIGVYFGKDNPNNICATLNTTQHTTQIAELNACISALQRVISIWKIATPTPGNEPCYPLRLVVIKTDSSYLFNGLTEWLPKWKENGWKACKGQKVANDELWRVIDRWIQHLEAEMSVQFWLVPKGENKTAEWMAHHALQKA